MRHAHLSRQTHHVASNTAFCEFVRCAIKTSPHDHDSVRGSAINKHMVGIVKNLQRLSVRPAEAAAMLGMSRTASYQRLRSGEIKRVKSGKITLIPLRSLNEWLERKQAEAR